MRRFALALVVVCAMTSLIVAVAATILTARSYYVCDMFWSDRPIRSFFVLAADGQMRIEYDRVVDVKYPNGDIGFRHSTDKVDGSGAYPDRLPGERHWFRWRGFALVTGARWNDDHHVIFTTCGRPPIAARNAARRLLPPHVSDPENSLEFGKKFTDAVAVVELTKPLQLAKPLLGGLRPPILALGLIGGGV